MYPGCLSSSVASLAAVAAAALIESERGRGEGANGQTQRWRVSEWVYITPIETRLYSWVTSVMTLLLLCSVELRVAEELSILEEEES